MPVTHEDIAALAYQFWKERGEPIGSPEVDWEKAEGTLQIRSVSLVKTKISESEPDFATTSGAGDELLAEKTDSVGAEQGTAHALNQESAPTDTTETPSGGKTIRRRSAAKPPVSGRSPP